ncbi:hypothetical protein BDB01DRAFT_872271 [Pilobolus umbonatus]|nr:hypothetical protein BDB01DRAFT_872271 [Pilobolus umbonatus]
MLQTTLLVILIISSLHMISAGGLIGQVIDDKNFCVFLPPKDSINRNIGDTEWQAQAFCLGDTPLAIGANKLSDNFIKSAHLVITDKYIQVTGQMDPTAENLNATDDGGQMDIRAPKYSECAGWKFYVNLIEPSGNRYCMRCCNDDRTCNRGISEKGCAHIIPGDYSGPYSGKKKNQETSNTATESMSENATVGSQNTNNNNTSSTPSTSTSNLPSTSNTPSTSSTIKNSSTSVDSYPTPKPPKNKGNKNKNKPIQSSSAEETARSKEKSNSTPDVMKEKMAPSSSESMSKKPSVSPSPSPKGKTGN